MSDPIIEVKDISFSYGKTPILKKASLTIFKGEFIAIFGPNGGGKTTLLNLLMGFLKQEEGSISVLGKLPKNARGEIGYVPQFAKFDKQFPISVFELVLSGAVKECTWWGSYPQKVKDRAHKALEKVSLSHLKDESFGTLSGGQAQRVLIARALVSSPQILLLDEPIASVDAKSEKEIYDLLLTLKGSMTILMVTHDLEPLLDKADRLLCVRKTVSSLLPKEACGHYSMGLYHEPIKLI